MAKYILSIDQSTTATKAILFDEQAELIGRHNIEHRQLHPQPGWVEHDPLEIYASTVEAVKTVLVKTGIDKKDVAVLSITNQRETTLLWESGGEPVNNAVVWQCCRAQSITKQKEIASEADYIEQATGLKLSPYFSAAKARWLYEHAQTDQRLLFGTMDSWLIYKLTGSHATDYSNASRTQLFNIHTLQWDDRLLNLFGLSSLQMPQVYDSDRIFGYTTVEGIFDRPIPVAGVMGDSHGALFGQHCWSKGMGKATFGTGSSVMMNIGSEPLCSKNGLATSIAWRMAGKVEYVFEGNINCSGDTIKWMVDELGILPSAKLSQEYAEKVPSSQGVYLVPAFVGLGAPHWRSEARAIICGLFRDANKYHLVRAGLESIAYQIADIVIPMLEDAQMELSELRVDGGPTNNTLLMQFTADLLGTTIVKNKLEELSALGAAYAGGLTVGVWESKEQLCAFRRTGSEFKRSMPQEEIDAYYGGWKAAVRLITEK